MTDTMRNLSLEELRTLAIDDFNRRKLESSVKENIPSILSVAKKLSALAVSAAIVATIAMGISTRNTRIVETVRDNNWVVAKNKESNNIGSTNKGNNSREMFVEVGNVSYDVETVYVTLPDEEISTEWDYSSEEESNVSMGYTGLSDWDIDLLVRAVQHETGNNPWFYPNGDFDTVQQYMAASILNRIGQPGFGTDYTTAYSVYDVLANPVQYGSLIWEIDGFDAYDERTRQNVYAVLNGTAYTPTALFFERCSYPGEDYWSATSSFYANFGNPNVSIAYMTITQEGRYIIFATNPGGAY